MQMIRITDELSFSRIIQGLWRVTDWNLTTRELTNFLNACIDRGVDTFDTADIYGGGLCEEQVGKALREIPRSRYKIVSKGGICLGSNGGGNYYNTSYDYLLEACRNSVRKLNCGYLDLYLIHREDPLIHHEEAARALLRLKADGCIREAGVSNFDPYKFHALNRYMGGTLRAIRSPEERAAMARTADMEKKIFEAAPLFIREGRYARDIIRDFSYYARELGAGRDECAPFFLSFGYENDGGPLPLPSAGMRIVL